MVTTSSEEIGTFIKRMENFKKEGNAFFQKGKLQEAIAAYTSALDTSPIANQTDLQHQEFLLRPTVLSNRALCRLKISEQKSSYKIASTTAKEAETDCTSALAELDNHHSPSSSNVESSLLRAKILYRRAKAYFLQSSLLDSCNEKQEQLLDGEDSSQVNDYLNKAAKDLLHLLSFDSKNSAATTLLRKIREKHGSNKTSPLAQALTKLSQGISHQNNSRSDLNNKLYSERYDSLKMIYGLLCQDIPSASMELGRRGAVPILSQIASAHDEVKPEPNHDSSIGKVKNIDYFSKSRALSIQILSLSASFTPFAMNYLKPHQFRQSILSTMILDCSVDYHMDLAISVIALMLRIVVAFHSEDQSMNGNEKKIIFTDQYVDGPALSQICITSLNISSPVDNRLRRAAIDLLSTWTSSDWEEIALSASSLANADVKNSSSLHKNKKLSELEIQALPPREFAAYRKMEYESMKHRKKCAKQNVLLFCDEQTGGLHALLNAAIRSDKDSRMRREIGLIIGRILHTLIINDGSVDEKEEGNVVKKLVGPILGYDGVFGSEEEKVDGLTIEEIYEDDEEEESPGKDNFKQEMIRALLVSSLLLCNPEVGTWALSNGWANGEGSSRLQLLIQSQNVLAMSIASELLSSVASVEKSRSFLSQFVQNGDFETLLKSENSDIRSGAASAMAKLGLASKGVDSSNGEGEVMGLLQVATDLLYEDDNEESLTTDIKTKLKINSTRKIPGGQSDHHYASTTTERGIELLSYLASKTLVKEELAHGFRSSKSPANKTALDRLVEMTREEDIAGESITSYGIATIFAHMAVSLETLRREAFIGKDVTAEQYNELQSLAKTQEEKDSAKETAELEKDLPESVNARIRKMASADVPLAMVKLMDACGYSNDTGHAHETTLEQLVIGMERMAIESSVRGIMIQQGCLSACIKLEKGHSTSEKRKKILRHARHCISKILVTTNPNLLTSAQRLGSIAPMIQLVNDSESSDLAKFEALLSITNLASVGMETKNRIISEKGINILSYAMFSEHDMVRRAATEAMSNLIPHEAVMKHLSNGEKLRLWVSFAADYEDNFECAKAATGCLAMASSSLDVAKTLVKSKNFNSMIRSLLECGNLELMHRVLVIILNLLESQDDTCRDEVLKTGAIAFCEAYAASYGGDMSTKRDELGFTKKDEEMMKVTVDMAMGIVSSFG